MTKKIKGTYHPEILKILKGTELSEIQYPTNNFLQKANDHFQKAEENRQEALASMLNLIFISRDISQLKNLQTSCPELINFDLMKKAFIERKDLINFIEFGLNTFTMKVKKTIPWDDFFGEQKDKIFPFLPAEYRTEEACFKWIKGIKNIKISSFNIIPKKVLKKLCQDNKEFCDLLLSVLMNQDKFDVDENFLNNFFEWSFRKNQSYWEDESKFLFYLEIMQVQAVPELVTGFNDYPRMIKNSARIQKAILPSLHYLLDSINDIYCECSYDDSESKQEIKASLDNHSDFFSCINIEFFEKLDKEDMCNFLEIIQVLEYHEIDYFTSLQLAFFKKHTKKIPNFSYIYPTICSYSCREQYDDIPF